MKELLKSVHICQSYRKNKSDTFLMAHGDREAGGATAAILAPVDDLTHYWS